MHNVDELFEREEFSAAPDAGWPDCFNSGVFVFRPSEETYQSLLQFAVSQGSFDGKTCTVLDSCLTLIEILLPVLFQKRITYQAFIVQVLEVLIRRQSVLIYNRTNLLQDNFCIIGSQYVTKTSPLYGMHGSLIPQSYVTPKRITLIELDAAGKCV